MSTKDKKQTKVIVAASNTTVEILKQNSINSNNESATSTPITNKSNGISVGGSNNNINTNATRKTRRVGRPKTVKSDQQTDDESVQSTEDLNQSQQENQQQPPQNSSSSNNETNIKNNLTRSATRLANKEENSVGGETKKVDSSEVTNVPTVESSPNTRNRTIRGKVTRSLQGNVTRNIGTRTTDLSLIKKANLIKRRSLPISSGKLRGLGRKRHSTGRYDLICDKKRNANNITNVSDPNANNKSNTVPIKSPRGVGRPRRGTQKRGNVEIDDDSSITVIKPEKFIKIETATDSEISSSERRRSDSLSKSSDTTDTGYYDVNTKKELGTQDFKFIKNNNEDDIMKKTEEYTDMKIPDSIKLIDHCSDSKDSGFLEKDNKHDMKQQVRRSTRQRKSTFKERERSITPKIKINDNKIESLTSMTTSKNIKIEDDPTLSSLHIDTNIVAKSVLTDISISEINKKDLSLSPELVSEGVSAISVKQFYGEPNFLENNLGIEKDPTLSNEIVQVQQEKKAALDDIKTTIDSTINGSDFIEIELQSESDDTDSNSSQKPGECAEVVTSNVEDNETIENLENIDLQEAVSNSSTVNVALVIDYENPIENEIKIAEDEPVEIETEIKFIDEPVDISMVQVDGKEIKAERIEIALSDIKESPDEDIKISSEDDVQMIVDEEVEIVAQEDMIEDAEEDKNAAVEEIKEDESTSPYDTPKIDENISKEKEIHFKSIGLLSHKAANEAKIETVRRKELLSKTVQPAIQPAMATVITANNSKPGKTLKSSNKKSLKTIIKFYRSTNEKRESRVPIKMTFTKDKIKSGDKEYNGNGSSTKNNFYTIQNESYTATSQSIMDNSNHGAHSRKVHNRSHTTDALQSEEIIKEDIPKDVEKVLVIPEKASSFKVHPGRVCQDQCFYCGGKFGLYDTPCHIAQIKSSERQQKILSSEEKLTSDSCLCDACYRHVDRRANCPSYKKRLSAPLSSSLTNELNSYQLHQQNINNHQTQQKHNEEIKQRKAELQNQTNTDDSLQIVEICNVTNCDDTATHSLRRKWLLKMKKSISKLIQINLESGEHQTNMVAFCDKHFEAIDHLLVCAICTRSLKRNNIYYITQEMIRLEHLLYDRGINVKFKNCTTMVCKLCRYYTNLLLKPPDSNSEKSQFVKDYGRRLLHIERMVHYCMNNDQSNNSVVDLDESINSVTITKSVGNRVCTNSSSITMDDKNNAALFGANNSEITITPATKMTVTQQTGHMILDNDVMVDYDAPIIDTTAQLQNKSAKQKINNMLMSRSLDSGKYDNNSGQNNIDMTRVLKSNPNISMRELFPGEEELGINIQIPFNQSANNRTPDGWARVQTTIQFDDTTRQLWEDLQAPYGNQSSFLRHLIILEKFFREGDLVLSQNAQKDAITYTESVQNRLRSYDNTPTLSSTISPPNEHQTTNILQQLENAPITIIPTTKAKNTSNDTSLGNNNSILKSNAALIDKNNKKKQQLSNGTTNIHKNIVINTMAQQTNTITKNDKNITTNTVSNITPPSSTLPTSRTTISPTTIHNIPSDFVTVIHSGSNFDKSIKQQQHQQLQQNAIQSTIGGPNKVRSTETTTTTERRQSGPWRPTLIPVTQPNAPRNELGVLYQTADGRKLPGLVQVMSNGKPYHISIHDYNQMCILRREKIKQQQIQNKKQCTNSQQPSATQNMFSKSLQQQQQLQQQQHQQQQHQQHQQQQQQQQHQQHQQQQQQQQQQKYHQQSLQNQLNKADHVIQNSVDGMNTITISKVQSLNVNAMQNPNEDLLNIILNNSNSSNNSINSSKKNQNMNTINNKLVQQIPNQILEQNSLFPISSNNSNTINVNQNKFPEQKNRKPNVIGSNCAVSLLKAYVPIAPKPQQKQQLQHQQQPQITNQLPLSTSVLPMSSSPSFNQFNRTSPTIIISSPSTFSSSSSSSSSVVAFPSTPSATFYNASTSASSGIDALIKSQKQNTVWLWNENSTGNNNNKSNNNSECSIIPTTGVSSIPITNNTVQKQPSTLTNNNNCGGSILLDNTTVTAVLSKIPKSLTVIPQHKERLSRMSDDQNSA